MKHQPNPKTANSRLLVILVLISCTLSITTAILHFLDRTPRIAYVEERKLVNGYTGMQVAKKNFEEKINAWQANLDTLKSELQATIDNYEKDQKKLSENERILTEEFVLAPYKTGQKSEKRFVTVKLGKYVKRKKIIHTGRAIKPSAGSRTRGLHGDMSQV